MKKILSILILGSLISNVYAESWVSTYTEILNKYATDHGVKYKKLKAKSYDQLTSVTNAIASEKPSGSQQDKLAFYLNAYNVWMLKKAVDAYPVDSLLNSDKNIYKREDIKVAGKKMSLDYLENGIIRKKFGDARIHFALNCASIGCPALSEKPFKGSTLDNDLNELTKTFLDSKKGVNPKRNEIQLSQLFDWFATDFKKNSPDGTVLGFIKKYRALPDTSKISYLNYSWDLNEH